MILTKILVVGLAGMGTSLSTAENIINISNTQKSSPSKNLYSQINKEANNNNLQSTKYKKDFKRNVSCFQDYKTFHFVDETKDVINYGWRGFSSLEEFMKSGAHFKLDGFYIKSCRGYVWEESKWNGWDNWTEVKSLQKYIDKPQNVIHNEHWRHGLAKAIADVNIQLHDDPINKALSVTYYSTIFNANLILPCWVEAYSANQ